MKRFIQKLKTLNQDVLGINQRNFELVYPLNPRKHFHLADDKVKTKQVLEPKGLACPETYAVIERIGDIESVWKKVRHHNKVVLKPANGRGGGGIQVLKQIKRGRWKTGGQIVSEAQIEQHCAKILMGVWSLGTKDRVLIEKCIEPHPWFAEIYPAGVPDFRIIHLKTKPILSMLRVPTDRSDGKANLHAGGMGIGINMETGRLTQGYDGDEYHSAHPDSGGKITGKAIPYWDEIMALSTQTSAAFPLDYLGIDLVIDKTDGPMVLEVNVRPGIGIQLVNRKGIKSILEGR